MFNASADLLLTKEYHKAYDTQKWSLYRKASHPSHLAHPSHLPCLTISDFPPIRATIMWSTPSILTTDRQGILMDMSCHQHDFYSMILLTPSSWPGITNRPSKCASGVSPKACALAEDIHSEQSEAARNGNIVAELRLDTCIRRRGEGRCFGIAPWGRRNKFGDLNHDDLSQPSAVTGVRVQCGLFRRSKRHRASHAVSSELQDCHNPNSGGLPELPDTGRYHTHDSRRLDESCHFRDTLRRPSRLP